MESVVFVVNIIAIITPGVSSEFSMLLNCTIPTQRLDLHITSKCDLPRQHIRLSGKPRKCL